MTPFHFTTGTGTPALTILPSSNFLGATATNAEGATVYLKLWWAHNIANELPQIGTTAPDCTIAIPSAGLAPFCLQWPMNAGGPLWAAVTKNAADSDDTALSTGGDVVTLFLN